MTKLSPGAALQAMRKTFKGGPKRKTDRCQCGRVTAYYARVYGCPGCKRMVKEGV